MRTAIVTGGSSGIGLAVIKTLISSGCKVYNWDFKETDEGLSSGAIFVKTDTSSIKDIENSYNSFKASNDHLDILICNAGIHARNNLDTITEEVWDKVINTNVKGVVFVTKYCKPSLQKSNRARIVIIGSDQCFIAKLDSLVYGASKGALRQLTKYLALELAKFKICVNTVCPATIDTPLARKAFKEFAENEFDGKIEKALEWEASQYPMNQIGSSEDVAEMVYYLATFKNSFTTGGLFKIDGGLTLS